MILSQWLISVIENSCKFLFNWVAPILSSLCVFLLISSLVLGDNFFRGLIFGSTIIGFLSTIVVIYLGHHNDLIRYLVRLKSYFFRITTVHLSIILGFLLYYTISFYSLIDNDHLGFFEELSPFPLIENERFSTFNQFFFTSNLKDDTDEDMIKDDYEKTNPYLVYNNFLPNDSSSLNPDGYGLPDICSIATLGHEFSRKDRVNVCQTQLRMLIEFCSVDNATFESMGNKVPCSVLAKQNYLHVKEELQYIKFY